MTAHSILITGAAGSIATRLAPDLAADHQLRLTDLIEPPSVPGAESMVGDLTDPQFAEKAIEGMDVVIHLAGQPDDSLPWRDQVGPNLDLVGSILTAAAAGTVRKMILASSLHAMGGYRASEDRPVDPDRSAAPCCVYGATKVFAEALSGCYARQGAFSAVCLRLGWTTDRPLTTGALTEWLGIRDLRSLIRGALVCEVRYGAYFGVSKGADQVWNLSKTRDELGYRPVEDSRDHVGSIVITGPEPTLHHNAPERLADQARTDGADRTRS